MATTTKKNVSNKIKELLSTTTPKQKAILVCRDWTDRQQVNKDPLLTEEEVEAIIDSLDTIERREFNKWTLYYNTYANVAPVIGLAIAQYRERAEEIVGYIRMIEGYTQEENHLNMIYDSIKNLNNEEALSAFNSALKTLNFKLSELKRDEEGYIEIDTDSIYSIIRDRLKGLTYAFITLKAFIIALDNWTEKKKSKKLMPPILAEILEDIRKDTIIEVPTGYSRKLLKEKKDKGLKITPLDEKKALFPIYEEIPIDEDFIELWTNKITNIQKTLSNEY